MWGFRPPWLLSPTGQGPQEEPHFHPPDAAVSGYEPGVDGAVAEGQARVYLGERSLGRGLLFLRHLFP